MRTVLSAVILLIFLAVPAAAQNSFTVEKLAEGVYAAIARTGGMATSNAFFVEGSDYVVAGGAHLTRQATAELVAAVAETTAKPIRYFILAHHHKGYSHIDFDFPAGGDVIMTIETWRNVDSEVRNVSYPVLFFGEGLTLKPGGGNTVVLTNVGKGHTEGDSMVYLPEAGVLFTSDLFYAGSVGYMGDGYMRDWMLALEFMEQLGARKIIPGYGPVDTGEDLVAFKTFFKDFLTAVLEHIDRGDSLERTLRTFALPKYRHLEGYNRFLKVNVERAYRELKTSFDSGS
jgi:glyoxylase-like metal-dependent hydrolase (beta-lactamase superfamily II)